jgi:integral membrane protein
VSTFLGTPAGRFRAVAIAEALSWAGLLVGMLFKYVVVGNEIGVQVFGPIHGVIFVLYVIVALMTWAALRWSTGVGFVAVLASIPPFGTWIFERWALRHGHLDDPPPPEPARA